MKKRTATALCLALCLALLAAFSACGHEHTWDASTGACAECGEKCSHEFAKGSAECAVCGWECTHKYSDGVCTVCGKTTKFKWENFEAGDPLMTECDEQGSVVRVDYATRAYVREEKDDSDEQIPITKTMYVYLPYGYTEEEQYDVLYLMHGIDENEGYWFAQGEKYADGGFGGIPNFTATLLDNLIAQGVCEPMIVVTPTFYDPLYAETGEDPTMDDVDAFTQELQKDIMPYIAENYSTYAASGAAEDLIAARDHQAFAGFSMGSMTTWRAGVLGSLEYFSWFGSYSAGPSASEEDITAFVDHLNANATQDKYPIRFWLHANGTNDFLHDSHVAAYESLLAGCATSGVLTELDYTESNGNCVFIDIPKGIHAYPSWIADLYSTLLVFFK